MQTYWLHTNKESSSLIIFFSGFAGHYSHYKHLKSNINVLLCYDYHDFIFEVDVSEYNDVWLVSYSMGVSIVARLFQSLQNRAKITKKIAFSGTNIGIDRTFGLHPIIFQHTIKKFNLDEFKHIIFGKNINQTKGFYFAEPSYLKSELQCLYDFCKTPLDTTINWDRIYIATKDKLFSPQVCYQAFSNNNKSIFELHTWHYPFFMFNTWEELCNIN